MINLQITEDERNAILACIDSAVKHAPNSLQAAASLLPLAQKILQAQNDLKSDHIDNSNQ